MFDINRISITYILHVNYCIWYAPSGNTIIHNALDTNVSLEIFLLEKNNFFNLNFYLPNIINQCIAISFPFVF